MDIKPSNVLLTGDGQPMLLDFHLARGAIDPAGPLPPRLGGTTAYASPEQRAAMAAIRQGRPIRVPVDGRSDIYSLGVLLYEALGGRVPGRGKAVARLPLRPAQSPRSPSVCRTSSTSASAADPRDRYPNAAALAGDLRRHLNHLPLAGRAEPQSDRTLAEVAAAAAVGPAPPGVSRAVGRRRRSRRPHCSLGAYRQRAHELEEALNKSRAYLAGAQYVQAEDTLKHGLALAGSSPAFETWRRVLRTRSCAWSSGTARPPSSTSSRTWSGSAMAWRRNRPRKRRRCSTAVARSGRPTACSWARSPAGVNPSSSRESGPTCSISSPSGPISASAWPPRPRPTRPAARRSRSSTRRPPCSGRAPRWNASAAPTAKPSGGPPRRAGRDVLLEPRTAWEHCDLGRAYLRDGEHARAALQFQQAVDLRPQDFWPNFYQGLCAYKLGRFEDALNAFRVCISLADNPAECYFNRALAYEALGRTDEALRDYTRALQCDDRLTGAALNRGILHYAAGRYADAAADLGRALATASATRGPRGDPLQPRLGRSRPRRSSRGPRRPEGREGLRTRPGTRRVRSHRLRDFGVASLAR